MTRTFLLAASLALLALAARAQDTVGWHVVQPGETLEGITAKYLGSSAGWRDNWKLNPDMKDPNRLVPGQRIRVIVTRELPASFALIRRVARRVDRKPEPAQWQPAHAGDRLEERHGVQTHAAASAELQFDDQTQLTLTERSIVFLRAAKAAPQRRNRSEIEIVEGQGDLEKPARTARRHDIQITVGSTVARPQDPGSRARLRKEGTAAQVMSYTGATEVRSAGAAVRVGEGMGVAVPEGAVPPKPEKLLGAPRIAAQDVAVPRPVLEWPAVRGAASYTVEVCRDRGCAELVARETGIAGTSWRPTGPVAAGELFWRVTARSASGLDGYPAVAPFVVRLAISGAVRVDGRPAADAGVTLYRDAQREASATTAADGSWTFSPLLPGTYHVVVDSRTIAPREAWVEQVEGPAGALCGPVRRTTPGGCAGGRRAGVSDDASGLDAAEHVAVVTLTDTPVGDADFGFSFDAVTSTEDRGQGSLRQFVTNANLLPGPNAMRFLPASPAKDRGWTIRLQSPLPPLVDAGTTIDGAARDALDPETVLDTDPGEIGSVSAVGASATFLRNPERPELTLDFRGADVGIDAGADAVVRNVRLTNAATHVRARGALLLENAVIGTLLARSEPSAGVEILGTATVRRVLVTAMSQFGLAVRRGGRLDAEHLEVSDCGYAVESGDGIAIESDGSRIAHSLLLLNTSGSGVAISSGRRNLIEESTLRGNRVAVASSALEGENRFRGNRFEDNILAAVISRGSGRLAAPHVTRLRVADDGVTHVGGTARGATRVDLYTSDEEGTLALLTGVGIGAEGTFDLSIGTRTGGAP